MDIEKSDPRMYYFFDCVLSISFSNFPFRFFKMDQFILYINIIDSLEILPTSEICSISQFNMIPQTKMQIYIDILIENNTI